jgi:adenylate cyclase
VLGAMIGRAPQFALFGLLATVFGMLAGAVPVVLSLEENFGLGTLFLLRGPREVPAEVVVIGLDKFSSDAFGLPNEPAKWPRSLHAELVERLEAAGATVIGFDVLFDDPAEPADDERLGAALNQAGNVILAAFLQKTAVGASQDGQIVLTAEKLIPPVPPVAAGALAVAPFTLPVVPVRVSQFWTFKTSAGNLATFPATLFQAWMLHQPGEWFVDLRGACPELEESLPATTVEVLAGRQIGSLLQQARRCLTVDKAALATLDAKWRQSQQPAVLRSLLEVYAGPDTRYLNYYGSPRTVTTVPYVQALRGEGPGLVGKIVLVGASDKFQPEQKDGFYSVYSDHTGLDISGVEVAATAIANMLDGTAIKPLSFPAELFVIGFWGLLVGGFCRVLTPPAAVAFSLFAIPLYGAWAWWVFDARNIWLPLFVPLFIQLPVALLLGLLAQYLQTRNQRERVMQALGTYLPKRAMDQLMHNLGDLQPNAELLHGTCMATDAEQYTRLAETLEPEELAALMNAYYAVMFAEVEECEGVVTDVVGDSMMAIWAVAKPDCRIRECACLGALAVAKAVDRFNGLPGRPQLPTRIGLHTGPIRLGNIGGAGHMEFRAVGDIVNTASRIESLNKQLGTRILVSGETLAETEGLSSRELGTFLLAGKATPLVIHELLDTDAPGADMLHDQHARFATALSAFRAARWQAAADRFASLHREQPDDGPVRFYAELCTRYLANGPDSFESGAVRLSGK